jgi:hypothetical protein
MPLFDLVHMGLQRTNFEYYSKSAYAIDPKNAFRPIETSAHVSSGSATPVLGVDSIGTAKWAQRGYPTHLQNPTLDQDWLCF